MSSLRADLRVSLQKECASTLRAELSYQPSKRSGKAQGTIETRSRKQHLQPTVFILWPNLQGKFAVG